MTKQTLSNWFRISWLTVALVGFIDSTYLTVVDLNHVDVGCSIVSGCNEVLNSSYSNIGPVPLALFGAVFYLFMFLGMIFYLDRKSKKFLLFLAYVSIIGFVMSSWLFFVQWKIIESFCQYCLLSALTSTLLFIFGMVVLKKIKCNKNTTEGSI